MTSSATTTRGRGWRRSVRRFVGPGKWIGFWSFVTLLALIALALAAPVIAPYEPEATSLRARLQPPGTPGFWLGTDALGRDVLSRLLYGGRISITIAFITVTLSALIGTAVGVVAGYAGGLVDRVLMRLIDVQLSFPFIILALTIAAILGPSVRNIVLTLVITSWVFYARLARGETLRLKRMQFVEASQALGTRSWRVALRHIVPNLTPLMIVMASLEVGRIIIAEAGISFLGYGVQPPTPAWGNMISEGRSYIFNAWWLTFFPGLAISIGVLASNLVGDWLRDILDPRKGPA